MSKHFFVLLLAVFLCSCSPKTIQYATADKPYSGRYAEFVGPGETALWGDYTNLFLKKRDGGYVLRTYFPETYTLIEEVNYADEKLKQMDGPAFIYYDDGVRWKQGQFAANKMTGPWKYFSWKTGKMYSSGNYVNGNLDGVWNSYYDNGELSGTTTYDDGEKTSAIKYDSTGTVKYHYRLVDGEVAEILEGETPAESGFGKLRRMPLFPGCGDHTDDYELTKGCADKTLLEFVYGRINYPMRAREKGVEGMAHVSFVIEKDGKVSSIRVLRGLNQDISREVERIVRAMPAWVPGQVNGENVRVQFKLPVTFRLE